MKAKIIYWGWNISWFFLFGGVGTMDTTEFGSFENTMGFLFCGVWFVFSLLLICHEQECLVEADKMEKWMDETIVKITKWFDK